MVFYRRAGTRKSFKSGQSGLCQVPLIATGTFGYPLLNIVSAAAKSHRHFWLLSLSHYLIFVELAQNEIAVVPDFHKRILFCDEAHFWLNGCVNKNCSIWGEANPQVYVETPLHPEKLTVWCALCAGGIIGPYFFKNDEGHKVTVNGDRYRAMITNFLIPELNNHDVQELWF
ncbi:transposable element Tc3 transposase [Trichonephila clavipes]|nr:transposable element Tc3 transposase [Trichonephila clavipes]